VIYKFASPTGFALENLASGAFYCRHFEDFNDPFEFWSTVESGIPEFSADDKRFCAAAQAWGFSAELLSDPGQTQMCREYFESLTDGELRFPQVFDHTRISCFSSDPDNLLMWSHYADGLRGFCVEIDDEHMIPEETNASLLRVKYLTQPPIVDSFLYAVLEDQYFFAVEHGYIEYEGQQFLNFMNDVRQNAFASKPVEWQYEHEVRLVTGTDNEHKEAILYHYPPEMVKSVILGEKMTVAFKEKILDVVKAMKHPVAIKTASRDDCDYRLRIS
jgi:hypothetical protein